jgi:heme oxygenase
LRALTTPDHARVDRAFARFDLSTAEGYREFLTAQARALLPLEQALDAGEADRAVADWPERRRSPALRQDLADLGLEVPKSVELRPITAPARQFGTIYVLEGSRLGGALLKRSLAPRLPAAFFAPAPSGRWQEFLALMEREVATPDARSAAVAAAGAAFASFEDGAGHTARHAA